MLLHILLIKSYTYIASNIYEIFCNVVLNSCSSFNSREDYKVKDRKDTLIITPFFFTLKIPNINDLSKLLKRLGYILSTKRDVLIYFKFKACSLHASIFFRTRS